MARLIRRTPAGKVLADQVPAVAAQHLCVGELLVGVPLAILVFAKPEADVTGQQVLKAAHALSPGAVDAHHERIAEARCAVHLDGVRRHPPALRWFDPGLVR